MDLFILSAVYYIFVVVPLDAKIVSVWSVGVPPGWLLPP